jgi:pilus assembly protein CpaE
MARRITALVAHDDSVPATLIGAHIDGDAGIELAQIFDTLQPSLEAIRQSDADLLLLACREGSTEALELVQWWHGMRVGRPVVVLTHGSDHDFVQEVFSAGADDLIVLDPGPYVSEQSRRGVGFAIRKAVARSLTSGERAPDAGTLVCVLGSKGGVGKTVTATNLSASLAQRGRRTALIDLDLQFGDVGLALGLVPETTLFDLAVSGGSLDSEKLDDFMLRHASGLRVLAAPARPDQAASVTPDMISDIYGLLRAEYDFVIVDTPPSFTPEVINTIDVANRICMVGMLDALSLKNTRLGLETLDLMGHAQDKILVALNRAGSNVGISEADAITILGRTPDVLIPSDREIVRSINDGEPVVLSAARADAAKAFEGLADLLVYTPEEVAQNERPRRRSLLRRRNHAVASAELAQGQS